MLPTVRPRTKEVIPGFQISQGPLSQQTNKPAQHPCNTNAKTAQHLCDPLYDCKHKILIGHRRQILCASLQNVGSACLVRALVISLKA